MNLLDPLGYGRPGFERHARRFDRADDARDLRGLTMAITGANSGLGLAATRMLAARGATVFMLCRDAGRGEAARATVTGDARVVLLDVSRAASVDAVDLPAVDVLVHNAGALDTARAEVDGLERTVATHVIGPYRLSQRARAATTIWVASGGGLSQRLDVARTWNPPEPFDGVTAYARCKRAQITLARRLGHHAMHPGWADTPGVASSIPGFHRVTRSILRSPEQGADTVVWLAATRPADPGFWFDRARAAEFPVPFTRPKDGEEERLLAALPPSRP